MYLILEIVFFSTLFIKEIFKIKTLEFIVMVTKLNPLILPPILKHLFILQLLLIFSAILLKYT